MTKPKRYKRYSSEFKREAILRASEEGNTDKAVCEELGISTRQFLLRATYMPDAVRANFRAAPELIPEEGSPPGSAIV